MTVTLQRLLTELGNRAWSGFNKDDMIFGSDEALTAIAELNCAHRFLMSLEDFPFQAQNFQISTIENISNYSMPDGQISEIINMNNFVRLKQIVNHSELQPLKGIPDRFWVEYSNPYSNLVLYPTPNKNMTFNVVFNSYKFILDKDGNQINEFQNADDFLNMPEYLENLYMDCLVLRTMAANNKDQEDENYVPTLNEFNEAWNNFLRKAVPFNIVQRIVI